MVNVKRITSTCYDVTLRNGQGFRGIKFSPGGNARIEDFYGVPPFSLAQTKTLRVTLTRKSAKTLLKVKHDYQDDFNYIVYKTDSA